MKKIFSLLAVLLLTLSATAQHETSVLFIGNSFTFMNNMPFIFQDVAIAKGHKIFVDTVVHGGKDFNFHAHNPGTYKKLKSRKWDFVIIQGHSNELAQPETIIDKNSLPYATQIVDSIRANSACTQLVLYMTWGYKNGNPKWSVIASYDSMQARIKTQYLRFADLLDARVSPVGEAWKMMRETHPGINLYYTDNIHPNLNGSYLSACTFFATIFNESPLHNNIMVAVDPDTRQAIEYTVSQTVLNNMGQWRIVQKTDRLVTGFDLAISGNNVQVYDRSQNSSWIEWNFGDGHTSSERNPMHKYAAPGTYKITQKISMHCQTVELVREITLVK